MNIDYLITGQGIAGSMLAWFLHRAGKKILILDEVRSGSASRIASGIINPITGKRLVKSWRADVLLPIAEKAYHELERELDMHIFDKVKICRIFSNKEDFQFFRQKNELGELPEFVMPLENIPDCFNDISFGGIKITEARRLDYPALLASMRDYFLESNQLRQENFTFEKLEIKNAGILYRDIEAEKIIFCEGSGALNNPYFKGLQFNLAKGEIITVRMSGFPEDEIWHKGVFIMPLGDELFRVGATYEWNFSDELPSEKGKTELMAKLKKAVNLPFEVIAHDAAIRPTVSDRRPLIGLHPEIPAIGIFNGLGTKGALLAPFFASMFADHLVKGAPLDDEVNIARFPGEHSSRIKS